MEEFRDAIRDMDPKKVLTLVTDPVAQKQKEKEAAESEMAD